MASVASARRVLLSPVWIVGHLLAITAVVSFTQFGFWQLRRHDQRMERNAAIEARLAAPPVTLDVALTEAEAARAAAEAAGAPAGSVDPLEYRTVRLTGSFDSEVEVLRRGVVRDGTPGFHVVTPLVLADGSAVMVDRGWVPQSFDSVPVAPAAPEAGEVEVRGWAFPPDVPPTGPLASLAPRDPPSGRLVQVAYVDVVRLADQVPYPLLPVRVVLDAPPRAPGDASLPLPPPAPQVTLGSHLGYALQWFAFVVITLVGYVALLRRRTREAAEAMVSSSDR